MRPLPSREFIEEYSEPYLGARPSSVRKMRDGAQNHTYEVQAGGRAIYLKIAREGASMEHMGDVFQDMSPDRLWVEAEFIRRVAHLFPPQIQLPDVLNEDTQQYILALTDVSNGGTLLRTILRDQRIFSLNVAANLGTFLGVLHRSTYNVAEPIRGRREDDEFFWIRFLRLRTIDATINIREDAQHIMMDFVKDVEDNHSYWVLMNMDCCPKNVLERPDGSVGVIDFEEATAVGDPAYDVGFLLGHYVIDSLLQGHPPRALDAIRAISDSYLAASPECPTLTTRLPKYIAGILLYRVDGKSRDLDIPGWAHVPIRQLASRILLEELEDLSALCKSL